MKGCELCDRTARMYCESDQASLCWDCDAKVHGANFLVERHPRVLLCRRCQATTPWQATGARLSPIISACDSCAAIYKASTYGEEQDEDDADVDQADMNEEQEDYQVVPCKLTLPPPASSSTGDESSSLSTGKVSSKFLKRINENADLSSEVEAPSTSQFYSDENAIQASPTFRLKKDHHRSFLQSDAPLSVDSAVTGSRVCTRRATTAIDLDSSASCSPPI